MSRNVKRHTAWLCSPGFLVWTLGHEDTACMKTGQTLPSHHRRDTHGTCHGQEMQSSLKLPRKAGSPGIGLISKMKETLSIPCEPLAASEVASSLTLCPHLQRWEGLPGNITT